VTGLADDLLVVGLGGNLGGDDAVLVRMRRAAEAFAAWGAVRSSSVYRTAPWGGVAQEPFLNAALAVRLADVRIPAEIIASVHEIEALLGRDRSREERWGPRPIDVDVLLWGPRVTAWPGPPALDVPHPRLRERGFALVPVIELVGEDALLPGDGRTLGAIARTLGDQGVALTDYSLGV
jgi:2-amino-4-hydroxy-6-hydroxymethyldihydropteridine diphosphokinase